MRYHFPVMALQTFSLLPPKTALTHFLPPTTESIFGSVAQSTTETLGANTQTLHSPLTNTFGNNTRSLVRKHGCFLNFSDSTTQQRRGADEAGKSSSCDDVAASMCNDNLRVNVCDILLRFIKYKVSY